MPRSSLRSLHQVVDVNEEVVVKLDEVDGGLGLHLVDDHARPFAAVLFGVLHLFPHQAVHHLARFPLGWDAVICRGTKVSGSMSQYGEILRRKQRHQVDILQIAPSFPHPPLTMPVNYSGL